MNSSQKNRVRLSIEALEHRDAPASLTITVPGWIDPKPNPDVKEIRSVKAAAAHTKARPFSLKESGSALVDLATGTITASASGQATHLGAFTLHDQSTIIYFDGVILKVADGQAHLETKNGDHLCASFTGTVNLATGTGTLHFEWTGGTGKFANATGATVWQVTLNPADLTYTAVAEGDIDF